PSTRRSPNSAREKRSLNRGALLDKTSRKNRDTVWAVCRALKTGRSCKYGAWVRVKTPSQPLAPAVWPTETTRRVVPFVQCLPFLQTSQRPQPVKTTNRSEESSVKPAWDADRHRINSQNSFGIVHNPARSRP